MNVPILGQDQKKALGPQIRLVLCFECRTIDELPDFEGNPNDDHLLEITTERHTTPFGTTHHGQMFKVPVKYWANPEVRAQIMKQLSEGTKGLDEAEQGFYDARSTFANDAMECFQRHLRPAGRCPDWKHDSKKLIPKTHAERKEAGLAAPSKAPVHTYLCDFCPAKAYMLQKARGL